jgi:very-short-patch-repair endonuclease
MVMVELDGRRAQTTSLAFEEDRARDAALTAAGYRCLRFTWRRINDQEHSVAAELRATLAGAI